MSSSTAVRLFVFEAGEAESDQQTAQQPSTESPYKHGLLSLAPAVLSSADIAVQFRPHCRTQESDSSVYVLMCVSLVVVLSAV